MDQFKGFMGGGLDPFCILNEGVVDDLIADGGEGKAEGMKGTSSVAGFFKEFAFCRFERGFSCIDAPSGATKEPLSCGVAIFFIDDELPFFCFARTADACVRRVEASIGEFGPLVELE